MSAIECTFDKLFFLFFFNLWAIWNAFQKNWVNWKLSFLFSFEFSGLIWLKKAVLLLLPHHFLQKKLDKIEFFVSKSFPQPRWYLYWASSTWVEVFGYFGVQNHFEGSAFRLCLLPTGLRKRCALFNIFHFPLKFSIVLNINLFQFCWYVS